MFTIAAFYHFFDFSTFQAWRQPLLEGMIQRGLKGTILLSPEGLNATIAGSREGIDDFMAYIETRVTGMPIERKESTAINQPFKRSKVRLKKETISLGEPADRHRSGHYVEPADWNALIADPDTILLDARNAYETHLGTFENAIDPGIRTFKQLPDFIRHRLSGAKHRKIATFCTGGIRCEKFSSWLIGQGFEQVYQLKGGILRYLEELPPEQSRWRGECFVFDERVAVGHGLVPSREASLCQACGHTLTPQDRDHCSFIEKAACAYCTP